MGRGMGNGEARMITLVEALNYRCLRYVSRPLGPFHILVGPNASGKTTFLDVVGFLRDLVSEGLDDAVSSRTRNPQDLLFLRQGDRFELALEARIPDELGERTARPDLDTARYEVAVGFDGTRRQFELKTERFLLKGRAEVEPPVAPDSLLRPEGAGDRWVVSNEAPHEGPQNDMALWSETAGEDERGWNPWFKLGSKNSALGNLPADTNAFPVGVWFREPTEQWCTAVRPQQLGHQTTESTDPDHGFLPRRIESALGRGPSAAGQRVQVPGLDQSPANGAPGSG